MVRIWGYILINLIAWDWRENSVNLDRNIQFLLDLRHKILIDHDDARRYLCALKNSNKPRLFWKEQGLWVDVCQSSRETGYLPRLWRLQSDFNYRVLFLPELPITFAIVIKH